ncbi:hypothetical protein FGO68_gene10447 [Halteria grandinella]|uniref:Uncharacterized protein n=1 Tax=Halteria grandinella TaxID=5974 RepID=A0A8J8P642_HALGN|nr:hypothetical protein FGO68_gene10447 [Halteria grandinella]
MILSFLSISIPGLVQIIQSIFLQFIYFDLLQTEGWLSPLFFSEYLTENEDDPSSEEEDGPLNLFFEANGFGSMRLINNLGSTFVYLVGFIGMHILLAGMRVCKCKRQQLDKLPKEMQDVESKRVFREQGIQRRVNSVLNLIVHTFADVWHDQFL